MRYGDIFLLRKNESDFVLKQNNWLVQNEKDKNKGQRGEVELEESNRKVCFPGG